MQSKLILYIFLGFIISQFLIIHLKNVFILNFINNNNTFWR